MGKYYWLKLKRDFFKRHDIKIIKAAGGDTAVNFYLQLLCESIDHDGRLRFSEKKPYSIKDLATITDTPEAEASKAYDIIKGMDLLRVDKAGTIYLPEAKKMTGSETEWAEKKRRYRGQQEDNARTDGGQDEDNARTMSSTPEDKKRTKKDNVRQEKEIEKEIELEIEKELELEKEIEKEFYSNFTRKGDSGASADAPEKKKRFHAPSIEEVRDYCQERKNGIDPEAFVAYYEANGWKVGGRAKMVDWKAAVRTWEKRDEKEPAQHPGAAPAIMEKEYTKEHLEQKEKDDLAEILGEE